MDFLLNLALKLFCILGPVGMAFRHCHGVLLYHLVLNGSVVYVARSKNLSKLQNIAPSPDDLTCILRP
jgi:hypothetical protein